MVKKIIKKRGNSFWFRSLGEDSESKWSFIPINSIGWIALFLLVALNIFAANYFNIMSSSFDNISKFLVVFLFSMVVFILFAREKTMGVKNGG